MWTAAAAAATASLLLLLIQVNQLDKKGEKLQPLEFAAAAAASGALAKMRRFAMVARRKKKRKRQKLRSRLEYFEGLPEEEKTTVSESGQWRPIATSFLHLRRCEALVLARSSRDNKWVCCCCSLASTHGQRGRPSFVCVSASAAVRRIRAALRLAACRAQSGWCRRWRSPPGWPSLFFFLHIFSPQFPSLARDSRGKTI